MFKKRSLKPESIKWRYRYLAPVYNKFLDLWNSVWANAAEKRFQDFLEQNVKNGGDVLDIGCGTGNNLKRLLEARIPFDSYLGVDLTPEMLDVARKTFRDVDNAEFRQVDLTRDNLSGKYDFIISTWVFSHLNNASDVLRKLLTHLKPGGQCIILFLGERIYGPFGTIVSAPLLNLFSANYVSQKEIEKFPGFKEHITVPCFGGEVNIMRFVR